MNRRQFLAGLATIPGGCSLPMKHQRGVPDPSGLKDCSGLINAALRPGEALVLGPGQYRIESAPIVLPDGSSLLGLPGAKLLKANSPDVPMIFVGESRGVEIRNLSLENIFRTQETIQLAPGQSEFTLGLAAAWNYPSITIQRRTERKPYDALHYIRDFRAERRGEGYLIRLSGPAILSEASEVQCYVLPGLCPLVAAYNSKKLLISNLDCRDGAIAYQFDRPDAMDVRIERCDIHNGQIRIGSPKNTIPPFLDFARNNRATGGASGFSVVANRIEGSLPKQAEPRYLKFTERVHGIAIAGLCENVEVKDNVVARCPGDGIYVQSVKGGSVCRNQIRENGLSGIGLENTTVSCSENVEVVDNVVTDNWFDGCDFNSGDPVHLSSNDLLPESRGRNAGHKIADNQFVANGRDMSELSGGCGIYIRYASNAVIENNLCSENNLSGLLVELSSNLRLERNRLESNGRSSRKRLGVGAGMTLLGTSRVFTQGNLAPISAFQPAALVRAPWAGKCKNGPLQVADSAPGLI